MKLVGQIATAQKMISGSTASREAIIKLPSRRLNIILGANHFQSLQRRWAIMQSGEKRVLASSWSHLADDVEQAFFRIERKNNWLAGLINGAIAGAAVAVVTWLVNSMQEGDLLLFACLGSSAASVVFAPLSKANSLRTIVAAYAIAGLVCVLLYPIHDQGWLPLELQCFLGVCLPVAAMRLTDTMHPAAIGSAMAFIIYDRQPQGILMLMLAILGLLTIVKLLAYVYLEDLEFRQFGREFRRNYYGREVTVTILPKDSQKVAS